MSYDLRIGVKVEGTDIIYPIATPDYDSPTYNIGKMLRVATVWEFEQCKYYNCAEVIHNIEHGIRELQAKPGLYRQYEPSNGWGCVESAAEALVSLRECIYNTAKVVPMKHLYVAW